ncbi:class I SAM-dependent methyltransferase [Sulfitobacter sp. F26169L]|uniref:class I SAM-dependent methyltransferase n=1 Tax=Sulfitobacter sp. F26169L TaxID=2996015 RepID=UPI002260F589|nr:class I SAM-dependent methyltransferase [Sulfitobacter sp. F26169L]MCX7568045.1 class I SAM-dependent methyltransferase [Sulfitobacter sp. F26169L]
MVNSITDAGSEHIEKSFEVASAQSSRALFWQARYMADAGFLPHMPLTFWLMDVCRPSTIVEIGTTSGQSYFTLCQAADRLNLSASFYAYIDPQGPDAAAVQELKTYNSRHYEEFSRIGVKPAADTLRHFPDGGIDILSVDMSLPGADVMALCDQWDRKLSQRGVVLFHNFQVADAPEREETLRKLLEQQSGASDQVVFDEGSGLAIVVKGASADMRLKQLAALKFGSPEYNNVHLVFRRLGRGHVHEWSATQAEEQLKELRRKLKVAVAAQTEAEKTTAALQEQIDNLKFLSAERAEQLNEHQVRLAEMQKAQTSGLTQRETELEDVRAQLETLTQDMRQKDTQIEKLQAAAKAHSAEKAALEAAVAQAKTQIDSSTSQNRETRAQLEALEAEKADLASALTQAQAQIETLGSQVETQAAQMDVMRNEARTHDAAQRTAHHKALSELKAQMDDAYQALEARAKSEAEARFEEIGLLTTGLEAVELEAEEKLEAAQAAAAEAERTCETLTAQHDALAERSGRELAALAAELSRARETGETHEASARACRQKLEVAQKNSADQGALLARKQAEIEAVQAAAQQERHRLEQERTASETLLAIKLTLREQQVSRLGATQGLRARGGAGLKAQIAALNAAPLFDAKWYLETYPDVREAGLDPARHFITSGVYEGRDPGPDMQTLAYYAQYPEALAQGINPVLHAAQG